MVNAVGERFAAVAAKHPDAMAVIGSHRTLSFAELLCASSKLASRLENEYHMEQQSLIALHLERSCLMVKSIMGVVLAQGCYVPVDTTLPEQRKLAILGDSHPVAIICTKASAALLPGAYHQPRQVCIIGMELPVPLSNLRSAALITPSSQDALNQDATDSTSSNGSSSGTESTGRPVKTRRADVPSPLLYVFYTSGSTGRPKGVMVEHAALCHRIDWLQSHHPLTPSEDRVLQKTSYGFGISEWEIFWPLLTGATMVLARAEGQKDPAYLYERVLTTHTTTAFFVPSALDAFLDEADQPLPALRYIFCCGEPLQPALCQRVHAPASGIDVLMCNLYGPTEADMTAWYVPQRNSEELAQLKTVPIGRPIDGCNLLLVEAETEDALKLVAPGALGEICFDSVGTMRGYLHQQALTAAVVFASPSGAGRRVFRTGDLGRYRDDGTLEFHGRKDRQVKVRGIRIELGEVEAALVACNHVKEARVMVDGDGASKRLVAYVAPDTLPIALIEAQVRERLPAAYVPSCFMTLAALPRNVNGKVDTGALPQPSSMLSSADTVVQPRTKTEIRIAEIWATVLRTQVDKLSLTRDFDASGGNSLLAGKVTGLLRKAYPNARIEGTAVYVNASIEKLAMHVEERVAEAQAGGVKGSTPPPSATSGYKGYDNCGCVALLWQTAVVLFMNLPDLITNLLEIYLYRLLTFALLASSHTFGAVVLFLLKLAVAIGVSYALHFLEVALSIIVNFIAFPFGIREGRYPLWGWTHMRWWAAEKVQTAFGGFAAYGGTPLAPFIMRRFGCKVGVEAMIHGTVDMGGAAASLITIGDHVTIQYGASINPVAVENGELIVRRVDIGDHSEIGCRAVITPGSTLPSFTRLQSNCSSESGAFRGCITPREPVPPISTLQKCLRLFVGLPINDLVAALLTVMSFALLDLALVPLYNAGGITMPSGTSILGHLLGIREVGPVVVTPQYVGTLLLGVMLVAFIFAFSHSEGLFLFVVALKFCVLGYAKEGDAADSESAQFRLWLLERFVQSDDFEDSLTTWRGTELLAIKYRMLGMTVGRRVQMDNIYSVEPELVNIGDNVILGNSPAAFHERVTLKGTTKHTVTVREGGSILDQVVLHPGCVVSQDALLGSCSVLADGRTLPEGAIAAGCVDNSAMILKIRPPEQRAPQTPQEVEAHQRHNSTHYWLFFNLWTILAGLSIQPIKEAVPYLASAGCAIILFGINGQGFSIGLELIFVCLVLPGIEFALNIAEILFVVAFKWLAIGRFKEEDQPFYTFYHVRWSVMILLLDTIEDMQHFIDGTVFNNVFHRMLGATVGSNAYIDGGRALEYDLLHVGEGVAIGDCNPQAHTVERHVIRHAMITLQENSTMRQNAIVMPGAVLGVGTSLRENGLLLKGEETGRGEVWMGNPATRRFTEPSTMSASATSERETSPLLSRGAPHLYDPSPV